MTSEPGKIKPARILVNILCVLSLFALSACHRSGTWEDDARNWERAFRSEKPSDVVVVHSKYWRSPHITYEFQYFFEIEHNDALIKQLFKENKLVRIDGDDAAEAKKNFFDEEPGWFAPKPVEEYEVWVYEDDPESNFRVFIDKETKTFFLADWQA